MPKGCSKCGTPNDDVAVFCRACGNSLVAAVAEARPGIDCSACGHNNRISASFCAKCGNDLSEQTIIRPRQKPAVPAAPPPMAAPPEAPPPPLPPPSPPPPAPPAPGPSP